MAVPEQLVAAERTLEAMTREIRVAECIALTQPIELGWLGGMCAASTCGSASATAGMRGHQLNSSHAGGGGALWRCNQCQRLVLAWRAAEHKRQCVVLPAGKHPVTATKSATAVAAPSERTPSVREQQAAPRKAKPAGNSAGKASSKADDTARLTKLYRVTYPDLRPGESMTGDLLAGYANFFNFTVRRPRSIHRPRRKRPHVDTAWLWAPAPSKPSPTASKSQTSKQTAIHRKSPKAGSKQGTAAPRTGTSQATARTTTTQGTRSRALADLPPMPPEPPRQHTSSPHPHTLNAVPASAGQLQALGGGQPAGPPSHSLSYLEAQKQLQEECVARMQSLKQQKQQQEQEQQQRRQQQQLAQLRAQQFSQMQQHVHQQPPALLPQYQQHQQSLQQQQQQHHHHHHQQLRQAHTAHPVFQQRQALGAHQPPQLPPQQQPRSSFMPTSWPAPTAAAAAPGAALPGSTHGLRVPTPGPMAGTPPAANSFMPTPGALLSVPAAATKPLHRCSSHPGSSLAATLVPVHAGSASAGVGSRPMSVPSMMLGRSGSTGSMAGMVPTNSTGMVPTSSTGMIPTSSTGMVPTSSTGMIPTSSTGMVPTSSTGMLSNMASMVPVDPALTAPSSSIPMSLSSPHGQQLPPSLAQQASLIHTQIRRGAATARPASPPGMPVLPAQMHPQMLGQKQQQQQQQHLSTTQQQVYAQQLEQWQRQQQHLQRQRQQQQQQQQQLLMLQQSSDGSLPVPTSAPAFHSTAIRPTGPSRRMGSLNLLVNTAGPENKL